MAAIQAALGLVVTILVFALKLPVPSRLAGGLLFIGAAVSWFQALDRTCIALAAAGVQDKDDLGPMKIRDDATLKAQRRQARRVVAKGVAAGGVLTVLLLLLPA